MPSDPLHQLLRATVFDVALAHRHDPAELTPIRLATRAAHELDHPEWLATVDHPLWDVAIEMADRFRIALAVSRTLH